MIVFNCLIASPASARIIFALDRVMSRQAHERQGCFAFEQLETSGLSAAPELGSQAYSAVGLQVRPGQTPNLL